jgi:hypothetical protein
MRQGPIEATTPSLGVSYRVSNGNVRLTIATEGGRGAPYRIVLLPMTSLDAANTQCVLDLDDEYASDKSRVAFDGDFRRSPRKGDGPYLQDYSHSQWTVRGFPTTTPRLVVLLYQSTIGHDDPRAYPRDANAGSVSMDELELIQLKHLLDQPERANERFRGLIRVPEFPGTEEKSRLRFAVAACAYPAGILDGAPIHDTNRMPSPADWSLQSLGRSVREALAANEPAPELLLLLGDSVYVDAEAGLVDVRKFDDRLRHAWSLFRGSLGAKSALSVLPLEALPDDHEIDDNWENLPGSSTTDRAIENRRLRDDGMKMFRKQLLTETRRNAQPLTRWFTHHGFDFFLLDTRSQRSARSAAPRNGAESDPQCWRICPDADMQHLGRWITQAVNRSRPAFLCTPSMVLPRRRRTSLGAPLAAIHSDGWCGYTASLHRLLAMIEEAEARNIVLLSGDEHLSSMTSIEICKMSDPERMTRVHSIHSSPLYGPFPFANSLPSHFPVSDSWIFSVDGVEYSCTTKVLEWCAGDGYAEIDVEQSGGKWRIETEFHRKRGGCRRLFEI